MSYTYNEAVWNLKAATETKELATEFERCAVTVIEITTAAFSGTIDIQGKAHEISEYSNVPYIRQDQATIQTPSVAQIDHTLDDGLVQYVVLGYWRRLQLVMTRTAGSITCGVAGSSSAKVFPYLSTKLIAGTAIVGKVSIDQTTPGTTNKIAVDGTKETAVSQETGAVGAIGWLSSIKGFLSSIFTSTGPTNAVSPSVGGVGAMNGKLRLMTTQLNSLLTGIILAAGTAIIGRVLPPATVETPFTGTGNLVVGTSKLSPGAAFKLTEIELHLSSAPTTSTQNLVITLDDGVGSAYDLVILTIDLVANAIVDLIISPNKTCKATDVITAAWTNTDGRTYGLKFKHQLV